MIFEAIAPLTSTKFSGSILYRDPLSPPVIQSNVAWIENF